MATLTELPNDILDWLEDIEDSIPSTDTCLEWWDHLWHLASTEGVEVGLTMLQAFASSCIGG
jgi:hypothetical protein